MESELWFVRKPAPARRTASPLVPRTLSTWHGRGWMRIVPSGAGCPGIRRPAACGMAELSHARAA